MTTNLLGLDSLGMEQFFAGLGEKPFRARQVLKWIHRRGAADFDAMTDIAKELRAKLKAAAAIEPPRVVGDGTAPDGTRKWLLKVDGANAVEAVFIPEEDRGTLCVSSQAGCTLDCEFCSTGKQGFNRNLSAAEIVGQLWIANQALGVHGQPGGVGAGNRAVSNVVFMGMGEPHAEPGRRDSRGAADDRRQRLRPVAPARHGLDLAAWCRAWTAWRRSARWRSRFRCMRRMTHCATAWCRSTASTRSANCWRPATATWSARRATSSPSST